MNVSFEVFFYLFAFICISKSFVCILDTCRYACKTMLTNDVIISIRNYLSVAFCFVQSVSSIKHIKNVTQLTTFFTNCKRITCKDKNFISRIIDIYIILSNLQTYYVSYFTYRENI